MSQTQSNAKPAGSLGAQAAAAATTTSTSGKASEAKPTSNVAAAVPTGPTAVAAPSPEVAPEDAKPKNGSKLYIVTGEVHEFDTAAKAEKFLNSEAAPTAYSVLRGKKMKSKQKVSLR